MVNKLPELLAPAGNMERLEFAVHYGADAVYCGGKKLGLRSFATNFTMEEMQEAAKLVHSLDKRIYVTLNAFMRNSDLADLPGYIADIVHTGIDALIVTDPAAIVMIKKYAPQIELHISTQANVLNYETANFYHKIGAKRIILARELSLDEIRTIRDHTPQTLELEAFVHGAMCISYSGRCLLSNFFSGRDGNRGECNQPCRFNYEIREKGKDGDWYPIEQDENGTYILSSRDLMMLSHIDKLIDAGICSLKIEGRMKTSFYVASVVNAYRIALDSLKEGKPIDNKLLAEMDKLRHRPYTTGFYLGDCEREYTKGNCYIQSHEFVAKVLMYDADNKRALVEQRNRFFVGDSLEVLTPGCLPYIVKVDSITNLDGESQEAAPHPKQKVWLAIETPVKPMDILKRKIE